MTNPILLIAGIAGASLFLTLAVAIVLVLTDRPSSPRSAGKGLDFGRIALSATSGTLDPVAVSMRDGSSMPTRFYGVPNGAQRVIVLAHGSGWHGLQFHELACAQAQLSQTAVLVPDLRGHGAMPARRGDVEYIGQLEDDLADLIVHARALHPDAEIILGGHSSGGGLVVRFAGGQHGALADRMFLLAPFLGHDAPSTRARSGGWASPAIRRIIGLSILNRFGIHAMNHLPVISFSMPDAVLNGPLGQTATTSYSYRLNTSFAPRNYSADLSAIKVSLLLLAGEHDEAFYAHRYEQLLQLLVKDSQTILVPATGHLDLPSSPIAIEALKVWLERDPQS